MFGLFQVGIAASPSQKHIQGEMYFVIRFLVMLNWIVDGLGSADDGAFMSKPTHIITISFPHSTKGFVIIIIIIIIIGMESRAIGHATEEEVIYQEIVFARLYLSVCMMGLCVIVCVWAVIDRRCDTLSTKGKQERVLIFQEGQLEVTPPSPTPTLTRVTRMCSIIN